MNQRKWTDPSLNSEPDLTDTGFQVDQLSRRKLLEVAVRIVGSTLVASKGMAAQKQNKSAPVARVPDRDHPGYIDAHVHVWTSDTKKYPLAPECRREQMQPPDFPPEELLSHAQPCGVSRIVLIQMSYYGYDNSYMLDSMRRSSRESLAESLSLMKPHGLETSCDDWPSREFAASVSPRKAVPSIDGLELKVWQRCGVAVRKRTFRCVV